MLVARPADQPYRPFAASIGAAVLTRYLGRKLVFYVITAFVAITVNFVVPRLMPGDPVDSLITRLHGQITPATRHSLEIEFGANTHTGLLGQYFAYWKQLFHGDLGTSLTYFPSKVSDVITSSLPWTLVLVGVATAISFTIGTVLGILVAWRPGSRLEMLLPGAVFLSAVPYFWLGLVVLTIFAFQLGLFPISGGYAQGLQVGFNAQFLGSAVAHAALPAITIIVSSLSGWMLGLRNMMVVVLDEDYVLFARAKGLSNRRVAISYAARNAILPNLASFALSLGFLVSGALLTEIIFSYPGIGYVLYQAVINEDYPLMQGGFLVITFTVLCANLLADIVYAVLDPRTRTVG